MCKMLKGRRIANTSEVTRDEKGHRCIRINILIDFIVKQIAIKCVKTKHKMQEQIFSYN